MNIQEDVDVRIFRPESWYRDTDQMPVAQIINYFPFVKYSHWSIDCIGIEPRHKNARPEHLHVGLCYQGFHYTHTVIAGVHVERFIVRSKCDGFRCVASEVRAIVSTRLHDWNVENRRDFMRSAGLPITFRDHAEYALKGMLRLLFT